MEKQYNRRRAEEMKNQYHLYLLQIFLFWHRCEESIIIEIRFMCKYNISRSVMHIEKHKKESTKEKGSSEMALRKAVVKNDLL